MAMHTPEASALASWLAEEVRGAHPQKVRCPSWHTAILHLRRPGRTVRLLVSVEPGLERFHTIERTLRGPARPFAFQGLLRKELRGPVTEVGLVGGDRILRVRVGATSLVAVLFPPRADLLLLDEDDHVLGSARGTVERGERFVPPPLRTSEAWTTSDPRAGEEVDRDVRERADEARTGRSAAALRRRLTRRVKSVRRTLARRTAEADRAHQADAAQRSGDLLQGAFHLLRKGLAEVDVPDYFDGGTARIQLDPALDPQANIQRWYQRARKARRATGAAAERRDEAAAELQALLEALEALEAGQDEPARRLVPAPAGQAKRPTKGRRLPYRSFFDRDGVEIRVGRSGKDNDDLSFRHSRGNDVWLHVRGRPGAHVVIVRPGPAPSPELLVRAAQLALKYSGLAPGARAEVAWTRVKELRKPPGLAPGKVLLRSEKVLYVEHDPDAIAQFTRARG